MDVDDEEQDEDEWDDEEDRALEPNEKEEVWDNLFKGAAIFLSASFRLKNI